MKAGRRPRSAAEKVLLVDDQELRVTNPDRVLYPATGTTKLEVIDYYRRSAPASLPHLRARPATRKRCPELSRDRRQMLAPPAEYTLAAR